MSEAREVIRLIMREGIGLTAIGLMIGCAGALAAVRLLGTQLYETSTYDPWTFAAVPIVLALVALVACYLPARRASSVDPIAALRVE